MSYLPAGHSRLGDFAQGRDEFSRDLLLRSYSDYIEDRHPSLFRYLNNRYCNSEIVYGDELAKVNGHIRFLLEGIKGRVKYLRSKIEDESREENHSVRLHISRSGSNADAREKMYLEGLLTLYEYFSTGKKSVVKVLYHVM
jgi:hypothetical protein